MQATACLCSDRLQRQEACLCSSDEQHKTHSHAADSLLEFLLWRTS